MFNCFFFSFPFLQVGAVFLLVCLAAGVFTIVRERIKANQRAGLAPGPVGGPPPAIGVLPPPENPEFNLPPSAPVVEAEFQRANVGW